MNQINYDEIYEALQQEYRQTQDEDPFNADARLVKDLPRLNQAADQAGLLQLLQSLVDDAPQVDTLSPCQAWAAMRDLGFVMGPIKRYGTEPTTHLPQLGTYLFALAERSGSLHPRDDVFTLTVCNPTGERRRTYTQSPSEYAFIDAVGVSMVTMDRCVIDICQLLRHPLNSPQCEQSARQAAETFQGVIDALLSVRTAVDPDWFANIFTRNLESIDIDGRAYHGPSADQTQMLLIDWMLYGQSYPRYLQFFESLQPHMRPKHRELIAYHNDAYGISLLERVRNEYAQSHAIDTVQTAKSLQSIVLLLKRIRTFRYPHRKIAMDSFAMRAENRQIGSGGLTPDSDLRKLIDWTEQAIQDLDAIQAI